MCLASALVHIHARASTHASSQARSHMLAYAHTCTQQRQKRSVNHFVFSWGSRYPEKKLTLAQFTDAMRHFLPGHNLEKMQKLFVTIDTDRNGTVEWSEFLAFIKNFPKPPGPPAGMPTRIPPKQLATPTKRKKRWSIFGQ